MYFFSPPSYCNSVPPEFFPLYAHLSTGSRIINNTWLGYAWCSRNSLSDVPRLREVGEGEGISRRGEANEDCRRKYAARQCIRRFITRAKGVAWERMSNDIFARMRGVSRSWGYARVLLAFPKTCGRRSGRFAVDLPVVCWETTSYLWSSRTPGSLKYIYTPRNASSFRDLLSVLLVSAHFLILII